MRHISTKLGKIATALLMLGLLYWLSRIHYLLFHSIVELFSIVVICSITLLVWNARKYIDNPYLIFLSVGLPFVGVMNLFHLLAYQGMGVFGNHDANTASQLWIAQRIVTVAIFLAAPFFFRRRLRPLPAAIGLALATGVMLAAVFYWHNFPTCYVAGIGQTPIKKTFEYGISLLLALAMGNAWTCKEHFDRRVLNLILGAIALGILADLSFTLYTDVYGFSNMSGHLINVASFYLIYKAIIETGFTQPQDLLYRNLKLSEEASRQAQQQMEELAGRLERMNRAKDDFMAMLGHELRNPLAPVRNSLYVLLMGGAASGPQRRQLEIIERQVGHMTRLVDDLLDVSRITRGKIELRRQRLELNKAMAHAAESSQALIGTRQHQLTVRLPESEVMLDADPARLEQILVNLLNNAAKYTPPGGRIEFEARRERETVRISVRDNGDGLDRDMLTEIFEPFSQVERSLDRAQGGLGLGLTLVRNLARLHGGDVEARSEGLGRGSEFIVTLPLPGNDESATGGVQRFPAAKA